METFCKLAKIVCHTFLMMRGAGYLVQFMEDAEYTGCCVHNSIYNLTRLVGQVKSEKLKTKSKSFLTLGSNRSYSELGMRKDGRWKMYDV
jgi:hypothetical protein